MNAKDFAALLKRLGACAEARRWARGKTLAQAWRECRNGQWMAWLLIGDAVPYRVLLANLRKGETRNA